MKSLNVVALTGKITGEPELRYLQNGKPILSFRFCFWTSKKDGDVWKESGNFIDVTQFAANENFARLLHDKTPLAIQGRLEMDEWVDKNTNQKRSKIKLIAQDLTFSGPKSENEPPKQHDTLAPIDGTQGTIPLDGGPEVPF